MSKVESKEKNIFTGTIPMFTWRGAVSIYVEVLKNPKAGEKAKYSATKDLLRLAGIVDDMNREEEK
jgi:hypothetical protein